MIISDHGSAAHYLSHLNYYRLSYTSAGGWLEVLYRVEECAPFVGTLPLMGELEMDSPDDGQHQITLGTDPFEITSHDAKIPQSLLMTLHPCEAGIGGLNDRSLSGAAHCDSTNFSWKLSRE